DLQKSRDNWPSYSRSYGTLSLVYYNAGDIANAKQNYKKAIELCAKYRDDINSLEGMFNGKEESKQIFKEILKLCEDEGIINEK
ncbi:MAG: hypothetical protein KAS49_05750, partial [Candidatus Cloacimonetes bacterium]|nr:hypothetical protein [Candidatus Cloacimonadota bacterium]